MRRDPVRSVLDLQTDMRGSIFLLDTSHLVTIVLVIVVVVLLKCQFDGDRLARLQTAVHWIVVAIIVGFVVRNRPIES
jgi:hypothetical protein